VDVHHVIEAVGIVIIGLVVYSYLYRWYAPGPLSHRGRIVANGVLFGGLSVLLMIARIQVGESVFVDARVVPIALVGLFEGGPALLLAVAWPVVYRLWLGGEGMWPGVFGLAATAAAAWIVHRWARREGHVTFVHAFALAGLAFGATFVSFLLLGRPGTALFQATWLPLLITILIGVGVLFRLFSHVAESAAAEAARRETAELRAVTLLARAAAHEINNPLNIVLGGLTIVGRRQPPASEDADWIARAAASAREIKEIVARMNRITEIRTADADTAHPMLDVRKSSGETPKA